MMFLLAVAALLAASINAQAVNMNDIVDLKLQLANRMSVVANATEINYGSGAVSTISYEGGVAIGADSLFRTDDCTMRLDGNSITYTYNVGQRILATFFRRITYNGVSGSGYYVARTNSLAFSYTIHYRGSSCSVRVNTLNVALSNVDLYISENHWNSDADGDFNSQLTSVILPAINSNLASKTDLVESSLETVYCRKSSLEPSTEGLDIIRRFLFE